MVGQFWEAHGTVMSCDSVQGYLAPPLHCWGIVWADLRHLTRLRLLVFVIQVHRIWVTALLSAQRPCSLCFSFLCRRVPCWSIMKRLTTAHLLPTGFLWLRPRPEHGWAGVVYLPLPFFSLSLFWGVVVVFRLCYPSPAILLIKVETPPTLSLTHEPWFLL